MLGAGQKDPIPNHTRHLSGSSTGDRQEMTMRPRDAEPDSAPMPMVTPIIEIGQFHLRLFRLSLFVIIVRI